MTNKTSDTLPVKYNCNGSLKLAS